MVSGYNRVHGIGGHTQCIVFGVFNSEMILSKWDITPQCQSHKLVTVDKVDIWDTPNPRRSMGKWTTILRSKHIDYN